MANYDSWENTLSNDVQNLVDNYFSDLKEGEVVYDIGANVGVFSDKVLNKFPNTRLVLFEPVKDFCDYLSLKFKEKENISIHNFALVDVNRSLSISKHEVNLGYNTISEIDKYGSVEEISGTSLSYIQQKENLPLPDLMKVDVETSEYLFIEGCKDLFKFHTPRKIVIEVGVTKSHPLWEKEKDMMEYLFSLGYSRFEYESKINTYEAVFIK